MGVVNRSSSLGSVRCSASGFGDISTIDGDMTDVVGDDVEDLAFDISTNRAPRDILESVDVELCRESFEDENGSGGLISGFVGVSANVAEVVAGAEVSSTVVTGVVLLVV